MKEKIQKMKWENFDSPSYNPSDLMPSGYYLFLHLERIRGIWWVENFSKKLAKFPWILCRKLEKACLTISGVGRNGDYVEK